MHRGFTLIELLGVIALLGILALITVPLIDNSLNKSKTKLTASQEKQIIKGAKELFSAVDENGLLKYADCLPGKTEECALESGFERTSTTTVELTLETIQNEGFLPLDIKDPGNEKSYNPKTTIIKVTKEESGYTYEVIPEYYE